MMCSNTQAKAESVFIVDLITTDEDKKFAPAAHMATAIIEIINEHGDCHPHDMHECGFTYDEVSRHWHMAHSLAAVEMKLMRNRKCNLKRLFGKNHKLGEKK